MRAWGSSLTSSSGKAARASSSRASTGPRRPCAGAARRGRPAAGARTSASPPRTTATWPRAAGRRRRRTGGGTVGRRRDGGGGGGGGPRGRVPGAGGVDEPRARRGVVRLEVGVGAVRVVQDDARGGELREAVARDGGVGDLVAQPRGVAEHPGAAAGVAEEEASRPREGRDPGAAECGGTGCGRGWRGARCGPWGRGTTGRSQPASRAPTRCGPRRRPTMGRRRGGGGAARTTGRPASRRGSRRVGRNGVEHRDAELNPTRAPRRRPPPCLPSRAPAALRIASSTAGSGGAAGDAKAALGAEMRYARRARPGPETSSRRAPSPSARRGERLGAADELEERESQRVDAGTGGGGNAEDAHDPRLLDPERRRIGAQVDLVQHDDLRPLVEPGAVGGELRVDRAPALSASSSAASTRAGAGARAQMARNSWPSPRPPRAFDQPGMSATTSGRPSCASTVPRSGAKVVNG